MKRALIYAAAILPLAGGLWLGVRLLKPGGPDPVTAGPPPPPDARPGHAATGHRSAPAPILVRKLADPVLHPAERIAAVRALPSDLSDQETAALCDLLRQPAPEQVGAATWNMLLNEIMEVLREPRFSWPGYGPAIAALMVDPNVDPVVRDYSAQHLSRYLATVADTRAPGSFGPGMDAFLTVLQREREAREEVTGTILMALCDLASKRPAADFAPYEARLSGVVGDFITGSRPASLANRISAIQAAGRMGLRNALPAIRAFARGAATDPSLRLSSVATLGYFADPADKSFLEQLAGSNDSLRFAAQSALKTHSASQSTSR